jgi:serine protease AprX
MPVSIPIPLIEFVLLGPADDRRQLQDSPILGDVWVAFGKAPEKRCDLLISPCMTQHAGKIAAEIEAGLGSKENDAEIAYLQGLVAARLSFEEVIAVVVPKTKWWIDKWIKELQEKKPETETGAGAREAPTRPKFRHEVERRYYDAAGGVNLTSILTQIIQSAQGWHRKAERRQARELVPLDRFVALTGLILWATDHQGDPEGGPTAVSDRIDYILKNFASDIQKVSRLLAALSEKMLQDPTWKKESGEKAEPLIWQVSLNREALPALTKSIPAVKADAATSLFKVDSSKIAWAVLDSGIDALHPAFRKRTGEGTRVKRSFDFKNFRKIMSLSNRWDKTAEKNAEMLIKQCFLVNAHRDVHEAKEDLKKLAEDARNRGPIHWELVERFVEIKPEATPETNHGTHVAGIIGANGKLAKTIAGIKDDPAVEIDDGDFGDGMCPDIGFYDFRVLGPDLKDTEFAIIAALQFIRYLNDRDNFFTIHGANLSLSIPHDVRNFACGRTPICNECERLVESGVVVVTAAGNHGYKSFETKEGAYESYTAFSITDPGNADGVITVGATHRYWPHTYGVSFFSSRGPTGDGRLKPDLVAPGERIRAPFLRGEWGDLDGTSMAAPHVSGAAAMLLGRYSELIGQPRRVKQILCESATDLGRERSFQGHGMLDVLRAFQSI